MSENELLCTALDNTSIEQDEENLGNSNPTYGVSEQFCEAYSMKNGEKQSDEPEPTIPVQEDVMTASYGAISSDQPQLKNDFLSTKKVSHAEDDSNLQIQQEEENIIDSNSSGEGKSFHHSDPQMVTERDKQGDSEVDDCDEDIMTGSYGEISLERELLNCDSLSSREDEQCFSEDCKGDINDGTKEKKRPDSLVLTQNVVALKSSEESVRHVHQQTSTTSADVSPSLGSDECDRAGSDTSGLSELHGTLTVDGDLVTFVAEDLQEKIKMSSPVSRWTDSSSFAGSRSSTPSLYRQALQPNYHIIDPNIITDLETHAKKVATCVDTMLENLSGTLQSISSLTVDCMETYESSVCKTCDAVDINIKAVYQLMAKCEELSNSMGPLYRLSSDVKHIKKMLEQLEHTVEHKS